MASLVRYSVAVGIATLTLDRPERLNAIDGRMIGELLEHLDDAAADRSVRSLILTGAGRGFCAGGDLNAIAAGSAGGRTDPGESSMAERVATTRAMERASELLYGIPKLTVAAVNGPCAGAGLSLACACDVRIAAQSAVFTTAFLRVGQTGDYGATWLLPRVVGPSRARELLLLSDRIDAESAAGIGLVGKVVADEELMGASRAIAATVSGFPPSAFAAMKANLNDSATSTLADALLHEAERMAVNAGSGDTREAITAFREGRTAVFGG
jgi:2-(1,2-epoxy-1,2-dihydrophenyl)acetyl-CoA isomerase